MRALLIILAIAAAGWGGQIILYENSGAVIQVKEKYGCSFIDTVTQVEIANNQFVLYDKYDKPVGWYPVENHSITIIERIRK